MIRAARPDDLPALRELERAAGASFRDLGMAAIAGDEPPSIADLASFQQDGRAWVVTDDADIPVAYLLLDVVDGNAHVEQVSVHPDHARQGLGRTLLDTAAGWAQQRDLPALTLTTFADVPWNAPYYKRLGFQVLTEAEMTGGLRRIREHEAARGLARWPRVTLRRPCGTESPSRVAGQSPTRGFAEAIAEVARTLEAEQTAQETLQKMVELAVTTIEGCDHAGVSMVDGEIYTPAATDDVPRRVDQIQYDTDQGPCLDAIRHQRMFITDDLRAEDRWPEFKARTVEETAVRSMLSFRLFLEQDTLGSLNLYSKRPAAFGAESQAVGRVFAAHAAVALSAARGHERVAKMTKDLQSTRQRADRYARQAELAVALQRSMLTELPDLAPLQVTARYVPAAKTAEIGGDWYDAFVLPDGAVALVVGDLAGHDLDAAVAMGQSRNVLRALAVDRREPPGRLLDRLDTVLSQLHVGRTATCVYARLDQRDGVWQALLANAGHLPPLHVTADEARYVDLPNDLLLGTGITSQRSSTPVSLSPGATLLFYTDGLIERRDRGLDDGLAELKAAAADLAALPIDGLCDGLLSRLVPHPTDDVCLLAVHAPTAAEPHPPGQQQIRAE